MRDLEGGCYTSRDVDGGGGRILPVDGGVKRGAGPFEKAAEMFGLYQFQWPEGKATPRVVKPRGRPHTSLVVRGETPRGEASLCGQNYLRRLELLRRSLRNGALLGPGVLEDYAHCALAALESYAHTADTSRLRQAVELGESVADRFATEAGFIDVEEPDPMLKAPHIPATDTPNYSGNSLAAPAATYTT